MAKKKSTLEAPASKPAAATKNPVVNLKAALAELIRVGHWLEISNCVICNKLNGGSHPDDADFITARSTVLPSDTLNGSWAANLWLSRRTLLQFWAAWDWASDALRKLPQELVNGEGPAIERWTARLGRALMQLRSTVESTHPDDEQPAYFLFCFSRLPSEWGQQLDALAGFELDLAGLEIGGSGDDSQAAAVPAEFRSRAMQKKEAARFLGLGGDDNAVRQLNGMIAAGKIVCETLSARAHVFDVRQFDLSVQDKMKAQPPKS